MQIQIVQGIYTDDNSDYRIAYPHNMMPVNIAQGISNGFLRPADGVSYFPDAGDAPYYNGYSYIGNAVRSTGIDIRGIYNWNDICFVVSGPWLHRLDENGFLYIVDHTINVFLLGNKRVIMANSFDYLAIASGGNLYLYNYLAAFPDNRVKQVTDADLGTVLDVIYIDGYFMTTDGEFLVVTELGDPFSVNPLKYGSSEIDPDPVVGVLKLNNEAYAINRYTIEAFYNKGSELFPFARIDGSRMYRGAIGTHAKCVYMERIAFLGSGKNESPSVWVGINAQTQKIATREIDLILQDYTEEQLKDAVLEVRTGESFDHLWVRLPDKTLIYDGAASQATGKPIWFIIDAGPKNICWCYDKWIVGNTSGEIGFLDQSTSTVWDERRHWEFSTQMVYNESKGAIVYEVELVGLPGRTAIGLDPTIWTSYSLDGQTWSQEWPISAGTTGNRSKRLVWLQQGNMETHRIQRFKGDSDCHLSVARLEVQLEGLLY